MVDTSKLRHRSSVLSLISKLRASGLLVLGTRHSWWAMRFWDWVTGGKYTNYYTTLKLVPWAKHVNMVYPSHASPDGAWRILAHELVHYYQFQEQYGWWGMVRRYVTSRGRLEIEAPAYALSIDLGAHSLGGAVRELQRNYFINLPQTEIAREIVRHVSNQPQ